MLEELVEAYKIQKRIFTSKRKKVLGSGNCRAGLRQDRAWVFLTARAGVSSWL